MLLGHPADHRPCTKLALGNACRPDLEEASGRVDRGKPRSEALPHRGQGLEDRCLLSRMPCVPPVGILTLEETHPFKYLLNAASGSQNRRVSWILGVASQGILSPKGKRGQDSK